MNPHAPLWWISAAALNRFRAELDAVVRAWATDWGAPVPTAGLAQALGRRQLAEATAAAEPVGTDAAAGPWIRQVPALSEGMAESIFGSSVNASSMAEELGTLAAAALADALRGFLCAPAAASVPEAALMTAAPGDAGATCALQLGGHGVAITVTTAWLRGRGWLARPATKPVQTWSPAKALAHVPVTLTVELGCAEVSVGQLSAISVDDVIVVSAPSDQPINVKADHTDLQLQAYLGRHGAQRAVQIISPSKRVSS